MVSYVEIKGFEDFAKYTENVDPQGPPVFFLFSGAKLPNGNSWCPDCVEGPQGALIHVPKYFYPTTAFGQLWASAEKKQHKKLIHYCLPLFKAEPIVKAYLGELQKSVIFVYVDVGDRDYWKDKACPFRTDSRTRLMVIPTIIKWKGVQRLEGSQCNKRDLLQMMFEEEE